MQGWESEFLDNIWYLKGSCPKAGGPRLMARGQEKFGAGSPSPWPLSHEPWTMSHEPRGMSHGPWAMSHEPLSMNNRWINELCKVFLRVEVSNFHSLKVSKFHSFKVTDSQSSNISKLQSLQSSKFTKVSDRVFPTNFCFWDLQISTNSIRLNRFWISCIFLVIWCLPTQD